MSLSNGISKGRWVDGFIFERQKFCLSAQPLSLFNLRSTKSEEENIFVIPHLRLEENPIALYISHPKVFT